MLQADGAHNVVDMREQDASIRSIVTIVLWAIAMVSAPFALLGALVIVADFLLP